MAAAEKARPAVNDEGFYEKLRDEGNSKEKSARIANAVAAEGISAVAKRGGESGSYDDWTVADLRRRAAELEVSGRSTMSKAELVSALREH